MKGQYRGTRWIGALCGILMTVPAVAQTATTTAGASASPSAQTRLTLNPAAPSCLRTNPFDTASAESVMQKVVAAGYQNVRGLYKGCDGIWRGHALQNGIDASIMVTPTGQVLKAGY